MQMNFKYPKLYFYHPLLSIVFLVLLLTAIIYFGDWNDNNLIVRIIIVSFFLYVIGKSIFIFYQRQKGPVELYVQKNIIAVTYKNDEKLIIPWEEIDKINLNSNSLWRTVFTIKLKDGSQNIYFTNEIERFDDLKKVLQEKGFIGSNF